MQHDSSRPLTAVQSPPAVPPLPTLSQRGRDLLSAIRGNDRTDWAGEPDRPVPLAFLVLADDSIDGELAGLALAKQLACPPDEVAAQSPTTANGDPSRLRTPAGPVALLMLDPLGATLRVAGPAAKSPPTPVVRLGPQRRAGNRSDWAALLGRLPPATRLMLLLDTTGQQHNLVAAAGPRPTVIIVTRAGADGRVAGYRKLKELTPDGQGQQGQQGQRGQQGQVGRVGFFFTENGDSDNLQPHTPLIERARGTFARLAETAQQFLNRTISFFGSMAQPAGRPHDGVIVDLLGQRPSLQRQENRQELTRWLADHTQPLSGVERAAPPPDLLTEEELAELAPAVGMSQPGATPCPRVGQPGQGVPLVASTSCPRPAGQDVAPSVSPPADESHDQSLPPLLQVVAVDHWPGGDSAWSDLISANPRLAGAASALSFRPPVDPATVLLHRPASGAGLGEGPPSGAADGGEESLVLARFAAGPDLLAAAAGLSASIHWARQHWPLLRLAYPQARLPELPRIEPVLMALEFPATAADLLRTRFGEFKLARALRLDLPAESPGQKSLGLAMQPV